MRLIDADALERDGWRMSRTVQIDEKTMELQNRKPTDFPAVDPQPDIERMPSAEHKGKWKIIVENEFPNAYCDQCGMNFLHGNNFCPNCGAKMEVEDEAD